MSDVVAIAISTLTIASSYGLIAVGISLTWSSLGMLNLAHGITFAFAGYGAWWFGTNLSSNPVVVIVAGMATGAAFALVVASLAFLPLKRQENFPARSLTVTLALNIVGVQVLQQAFGPQAQNIPDVFTFEPFTLFGTTVLPDRAGAIAVATVVLGGLLVWARTSRAGLQLRALMQNPEGAALVGIGLNQTAMAVMAVSGALAGLAAVLLQNVFFVSPVSWSEPLTRALVIALLGGLGSLSGALGAAFILGLTEALTARYLGGQNVLYVQFAVVIAVLLVRPRGLGGLLDEVREADE